MSQTVMEKYRLNCESWFLPITSPTLILQIAIPFNRYPLIKVIIFAFNLASMMIIWHLMVSSLSIEALIHSLDLHIVY